MTIDELLARARRRLQRVTVEEAIRAVRDGAVIVDIRSEAQRATDGSIPGAIFHPRNVLEWRCDPSSGYDDPRLSGDLGRRIVLEVVLPDFAVSVRSDPGALADGAGLDPARADVQADGDAHH